MRLRLAALTLVTLGLAASAARAGIVAPKAYTGALVQGSVDALLVHAGSDELLVLASSYELTGKGAVPASLAWIVPVPTPPAESSGNLEGLSLGDIHALGTDRPPGPAAPPGEIRFEYTVTPIAGRGPEAIAALGAWLDANGFPAAREKDLRFYAQAGLGFAAVTVKAEKAAGGGVDLPAKGTLPPLAIRFTTARPWFPLKTFGASGPFDATLTVLTAKPIDPARMQRYGFDADGKRAATLDAAKLPASLQGVLGEKGPGAGLLAELGKGPVNLLAFEARGLNGEGKPKKIEGWLTDPELPWKR